jgi:hypothetical protein
MADTVEELIPQVPGVREEGNLSDEDLDKAISDEAGKEEETPAPIEDPQLGTPLVEEPKPDEKSEQPSKEEEEPVKAPAPTEETPAKVDEPSGEEKPVVDDAQKIQAIREKYGDNQAEIAKAYLSSQRGYTKVKGENAKLLEVMEEQNRLLENLASGKETGDEQKETSVKEDPLAELILDDPSKAVEQITLQVQQNLVLEQAKTHNDSLIASRGRELLLDAAKLVSDKDAIEKFSNNEYVPSDAELEAVSAQLNKEIKFIQDNFLPDKQTLKYNARQFAAAQYMLDPTGAIKSAEQRGADRVLDDLKGQGGNPVTLDPKGSSSRSAIDLSKAETREDAKRAARGLSDKDLDAALGEEPDPWGAL